MMTQFSINSLVYLISFLVLTTGEEVCEEIEISGAQYHPLANGVYYYAPDIHCNSRPVWTDAANHHYIYYLLDGYDGWVISADSCYKWGNFKLKTRTTEPLPYGNSRSLTWSEYLPEKAVWEKSDSFQINCYISKKSETGLPTSPSNLQPGIPVKESKCSTVLCPVNTWCVEYENGEVNCQSKTVEKDMHLNHVYFKPIGLAVSVVFLAVSVVFLFVAVRCCISQGYCKKSGKVPPAMSSSIKYKPLEEETTAHPA